MSLRRLLGYTAIAATLFALTNYEPYWVALLLLYSPSLLMIAWIARHSNARGLHLTFACVGALLGMLLTPRICVYWGRVPSWFDVFVAHSVPLGINVLMGVALLGFVPCAFHRFHVIRKSRSGKQLR